MQLSWLVGAMVSLLGLAAVEAKDYSTSPNHSWFQDQRSHSGMACCEVADGQRVDDADWKTDSDGHYWVKLSNEWRIVPDDAVINPKDRPIDYAVVWLYQGRIMCFLVGSGM